MTALVDKIKNGTVARRLASIYAAVLVSFFLLAVPGDGYSAIADFKYSFFLILSFSYIFFMLITTAVSAALGEKPDLKRYVSPVNIALVSYFVLSAVSACLSPYGTETLLGGTRHDGLLTIGIYAVTFLLLSRHFKPDRFFINLSAFSVTAFCIISMLQLEGLNPLSLYPDGLNYFGADKDYMGAYIGTIGNTNFAAPVLAAAAAAYIALMIRARDPKRILLAVPVVLSLYVLIKIDVSSSLLALICFIPLSLPVMAGSSKKLRRAAFILIPVFFAAALLLLLFGKFESGILYEASFFIRGKGEPQFGTGRLAIWRDAISAFRNNPFFGTGPDTFRFLNLEFYHYASGTVTPSYITAAHNDYLNILVNQGIFALASYITFLIMLAIKWYRRHDSAALTASGCFAVVFAVQLFFGISMPLHMPFFWLALAVINGSDINPPFSRHRT